MTEDKVPIYPSIVAFESSTLKIEFNFTKLPENPQATDIVASFTNRPLHIYLTTINLTDNVDLVQWIPEDIPLQSYSTGMIYNLIRDQKPPVSWAKVIWTKKGIPKHNFLAWLVLLNRCPTKDRIIGWGLTTDTMCLLCNNVPETRDHLFFDYWYSIEVWSSLAMNAQAQPIRQWNSLIAHVESLSSPKHLKLLNLLAMQAAIYFIWTERNSDFTDSSSVHPLR